MLGRARVNVVSGALNGSLVFLFGFFLLPRIVKHFFFPRCQPAELFLLFQTDNRLVAADDVRLAAGGSVA